MRSRGAIEIIQTGLQRGTERGIGISPQAMRFSATRAAEIAVADVSKLPVLVNNTTLQNADGKSVFVVGYSAVGGSDVVG